jgi:putative membrane protein insertion efficiency factor
MIFRFLLLLINTSSVNMPAQTEPIIPVNALDQVLFLYKQLISNQDGPVCNFELTCSNYGFKSIKQHGPILGLIMATDRLLRCNPEAPLHYPQGEHGLIDPIDKNWLFTPTNKIPINDFLIEDSDI